MNYDFYLTISIPLTKSVLFILHVYDMKSSNQKCILSNNPFSSSIFIFNLCVADPERTLPKLQEDLPARHQKHLRAREESCQTQGLTGTLWSQSVLRTFQCCCCCHGISPDQIPAAPCGGTPSGGPRDPGTDHGRIRVDWVIWSHNDYSSRIW